MARGVRVFDAALCARYHRRLTASVLLAATSFACYYQPLNLARRCLSNTPARQFAIGDLGASRQWQRSSGSPARRYPGWHPVVGNEPVEAELATGAPGFMPMAPRGAAGGSQRQGNDVSLRRFLLCWSLRQIPPESAPAANCRNRKQPGTLACGRRGFALTPAVSKNIAAPRVHCRCQRRREHRNKASRPHAPDTTSAPLTLSAADPGRPRGFFRPYN